MFRAFFAVVVFTLLGVGTLLTGCQSTGPVHMYQGPQKAENELVKLSLPETVELIAADNQRINALSQFASLGSREFYFLPGDHEIALFYETIWDIDADSHEVTRSKPVIIQFSAAAGEHALVEHDPANKLEQARELADDFKAWVRIEGKQQKTHSVKAAIVTTAHVPVASRFQTGHSGDDMPAQTSDNALEQLKHWWQNASTEEREAFRKWADSK